MESSVLKALTKLFEGDHMVLGAKSSTEGKVKCVDILSKCLRIAVADPRLRSLGNTVLIRQLATSY